MWSCISAICQASLFCQFCDCDLSLEVPLFSFRNITAYMGHLSAKFILVLRREIFGHVHQLLVSMSQVTCSIDWHMERLCTAERSWTPWCFQSNLREHKIFGKDGLVLARFCFKSAGATRLAMYSWCLHFRGTCVNSISVIKKVHQQYWLWSVAFITSQFTLQVH